MHIAMCKSRARDPGRNMFTAGPFAHIPGWPATTTDPHSARSCPPPALRSPRTVGYLKGVAGLTCQNAPGTRQEAQCDARHQGAAPRDIMWARDARFGGSGMVRGRHFVYYIRAHLPRTQAPRGRPPRQSHGPVARHHSRRPIRGEGHLYASQWARGGEAGEGRVLGQRVGGGRAGRLTEGRSGRVEADSGPRHDRSDKHAQRF